MKKFLTVLVLSVISAFCAIGFVACDSGSAKLVSAEGFTMEGNDWKTTVSKDTETFSFLDTVTVSGNATYIVSTDEYGMNVAASKTVPLVYGDNIFYLIVTSSNGEVVNVYTMMVYRMHAYIVSFDTKGGSEVNSQQVEEGSCVTEPKQIPTKSGYSFIGWDFDFTSHITSNIIINAQWTADSNIPYTVEYYKENLEDNNYTLYETENLTGITNMPVTAQIKVYQHFTHTQNYQSQEKSNIDAKGNTVLRVYYKRNTYTVTVVSDNDNVTLDKTFNGKYKYGDTIPNITVTFNHYMWYENSYYINNVEYSTDQVIAGFEVTDSVNYIVTCPIKEEMSNFNFIANDTGCEIISVKNKTIKEIIVPDYVTNIKTGAFKGCSELESIIIPFLGTSDYINSLFGYFFGKDLYEGSVHVYQIVSAYNNGGQVVTSVYIPSNLRTINLKTDKIIEIEEYAFSNCSHITSITVSKNVTSIGRWAFYGCLELDMLLFDGTVKQWQGISKDSQWNYNSGITRIHCIDDDIVI